MPRPDIEAIRARAEAATPGPWEAHAGTITTADGEDVVDWVSHKAADVALIAASRQDIPALLAYVAELEQMARAVADMPLGYSHEAGNYCVLCDADDHARANGNVQHERDCPVTRARALLPTDTKTPPNPGVS